MDSNFFLSVSASARREAYKPGISAYDPNGINWFLVLGLLVLIVGSIVALFSVSSK